MNAVVKQLTEEELKLQFAKFFLRHPKEPFKAALLVFPNNTNRALRVANEWPVDPYVIQCQSEQLEEHGELAFLPTKGELARKIWERVESPYTADDNFAKVGELYGKVMGYIEKAHTNVTANVAIQNRVMVVRTNGSDEEWEAKMQAQQEKLIKGDA